MAEYLYLFRGGDARKVDQSPEQMQAHMEKWKTWMAGLAENGKLIAGEPLNQGGSVVTNSNVTDGPFAEGKEVVGGYLKVNASDINEAVELSKGCPILEFDDGNIEVREVLSMDM